jgi:hypothetical protein
MLEPDPTPSTEASCGQPEKAGTLVLALPFPMPLSVQAGDEANISLTFLGEAALAQAPQVWAILADAGARLGFDPAHTTFMLGEDEEVEGPQPIELPLHPGPPDDAVSELRVTLTGPLFLRQRDFRGHRHPVTEPTLTDLLRASLSTLGSLFALYGRPLPADFAALKEAARKVQLVRSNYVPFQQHYDSQGPVERGLVGVVGNGVYSRLPRGLIPWLQWGGRVHVGAERAAGAGGWQVGPP